MKFRTRFLTWRCLPLLLPLVSAAETVHIYTERDVNGVVTGLTDVTVDTGTDYSPASAAQVSGYIFTGWTISANQAFTSRDHYGRSLENVSLHVYEQTTLTAHYLPTSLDSDADGLADGWEQYWFGSLAPAANDDTDGDGYTHAMEQALGTNPHLRNRRSRVGVISAGGSTVQYNPEGIGLLTIRSEPEGALFATTREYLKPGAVKTTSSFSPNSSKFAYWSKDGVRQADRRGRAVDSLTVVMESRDVELVAVCVDDATARKIAYWYGEDVGLDSDTDNDGYTLAMEFALGTNPLLPNRRLRMGTISAAGSVVQYNPDRIHSYVIRSEPAGQLFTTRSDFARPGTVLTSPTCNPNSTQFAYWTLNGVRQADRRGRALDAVTFTMGDEDVELVAYCIADTTARKTSYWYEGEVALDSDTDGDGYTLAMELALGTNPLIADRRRRVGVISASGETRELNLQVYEKIHGMVVDGAYDIFNYGDGSVVPIVADCNNDGLWDVIVLHGNATNVYLNVGSSGNSEFEAMSDSDGAAATSGVDLAMNSPEKLAGLSLDVPAPGDALSATTNGTALLVSDSEGRIWYYMGNGGQGTGNGTGNGVAGTSNSQLSTFNFQLQHKVWGGSHAGFAQGLRLAAVDWDDDGDLDCLAGTADGKLMLLRDPKVGRPTNLKAFAGVDNVLLTWDPNQHSRIRGYRVYRGNGELGTGNGGDFARIAQPQLPTYRDFPGSGDEFAYKVSSVSRFYTAGNSTPTETESHATEAVTARLGSVRFFWNNAVAKVGEQVAVMLSIENSMNYDVAGMSEVVVYDPEYLTPVKVVKTGLTEECEVVDEVGGRGATALPAGEWRITVGGASGTASGQQQGGAVILPAGGGKFLSLVFEAKKEGVTTVGGRGATSLPAGDGAYATVSIAARSVIAPYRLGDLDGDGDLDEADLRLLAKLTSVMGRKWNADELKAGDFNGNGKLDNADYQALREQLKEKGIIR